MPSNTNFTSKYTPAEITSIAQNIMSIGHCKEREDLIDTKSNGSQTTVDTPLGNVITHEPIYKIYEKTTIKSDKKRQIALFNAVEIDLESDTTASSTSLSIALNAYKNSTNDCHELIIPIYNKNHNPKLYKLLHVEVFKQADSGDIFYNWSLYNPYDSENSDKTTDHFLIDKIFTNVFGALGNGNEVCLNQTQADIIKEYDITIQSAMCTLYNYLYILQYKNVDKNFKLNSNMASEFNNFLKLTHCNLKEAYHLVRNYTPPATSSASANAPKISDSPSASPKNADPRSIQKASATIQSTNSSGLSINKDAPLTLSIGNISITLNPIKSEQSAQNIRESIDSNSSPELSTLANQPITLSVNEKEYVLNPITEPFELIKQLQTKIINTKDWETKLGGNNVFYYYKTASGEKDLTKESTYANVPDGVKLILDTIQAVQNHISENKNNISSEDINDLYAAAYCKIREIAQNKLNRPGFNIGFFKARSITTTNFYQAIVDDPNSKNIVSSAHKKLNSLLKK